MRTNHVICVKTFFDGACSWTTSLGQNMQDLTYVAQLMHTCHDGWILALADVTFHWSKSPGHYAYARTDSMSNCIDTTIYAYRQSLLLLLIERCSFADTHKPQVVSYS